MSTINLAVEKGAGNNYPNFFKGGFFASSFVLVLLLGLYGGLLYTNKDLNAKIQDVQAQYAEEYDKFLVGNANEVIDFRNRSAAAETLIAKDRTVKELFGQLEGSILPAVYLNSLQYDRDSHILNLGCVTDGFNTEAKQLLSFKENAAVASMVLGKNAIDAATQKLNFVVSLKMK